MSKPSIFAPFLQKNDRVAITATARKIALDELKPAIELLQKWKLNPVIGQTIDCEHHQFAHNDLQRAKDLQYFLDQPNIKAIWCARGGYGTARILDQLQWQHFKKYPKWVIGYSDITALHAHIGQQTNIATLHATMPINVASNSPEALLSLQNALFGNADPYQSQHTHPLNQAGTAVGKLIGGNLSVLYSLVQTPSMPKPNNCILFLEDLDEYLYHIDRMMLALYRSGFLAKLSGIVVGSMTDMKDNNIAFGLDAYQIIAQYTQKYAYPVLMNYPSGHIANNHCLIIGGSYRLNVHDKGCSFVLTQ